MKSQKSPLIPKVPKSSPRAPIRAPESGMLKTEKNFKFWKVILMKYSVVLLIMKGILLSLVPRIIPAKFGEIRTLLKNNEMKS